MPRRPKYSLLVFLFTVALLSSLNIQKQKAGAESPVPPPPSQRADRFGVYNWNVSHAAAPTDGSTDRLNWGANKVAEVGSRTIRVAIGTRDDSNIYGVNPSGATELVQIAQSPAYDRLFRDERFQAYILTAYSLGDAESNWINGYTESEYATERDEIQRLGEHLLSNPAYAGKTFIIMNWEGDNAVYGVANKRSGWDYYTNWIRARAEGVKLARQNFPSSKARLFSGLEFSAVRSPKTGQPCGTPVANPVRNDPLQNRCVIDYVAPRVEVDYYSYSSWQSIVDRLDYPNESLKKRYRNDLNFALSKVQAKRPEITERNFIVGEFGFERTSFGECNAANHLNEMFDAFDGDDAFHPSYVIFWQIIDNARSYGAPHVAFGLFRARDGALGPTLLSETFQKKIAGEQAPNYTRCPRIRRWPEPPGVLTQDGTTDFKLNPDPVISIYTPNCCQKTEAPFSASGNTVHFNQSAYDFDISRDNASLWEESPMRINLSIPSARVPGEASVFVTDAHGIDSNQQSITLSCPDCPRVSPTCGVFNATNPGLQIEPDSVISINGSGFSPSGNTIVFRLLQPGQNALSRTLSRQNILFESPNQINLRLPSDLPKSYQAIVYVVNQNGLGSRESVIGVYPHCEDCSPELRPCQAIVNEAGGGFLPGSATTALGQFSAGGNYVIIEQVDKENIVHQYTLAQGADQWSEDIDRIHFSLPETLFPGRALIYVVDAKGRETSAREIFINATPFINVSAANYRGPILSAESVATAFGSSLASTSQAAPSTPLPTEMAGTRVIVKDIYGAERPAPLFYVSPGQVNYQVPAGTAPGWATVTVFSESGSPSTEAILIADVAPGLFSADASGKGLAAALALRKKADGELIYESVLAYDQNQSRFVPIPIEFDKPGDEVFLILFGTGWRGRNKGAPVTATVGGIPAQVLYAGPQGGLVGVDQLNLLLPRSLAGKGDANINVTIDGHNLNTVKVNIK